MSETIKKVLYNVDQTNDVTSAEQAQARANIGAASASDVTGRTVYVDWDGTSDKFADIAAIVAAGDVPVVRYNGYDYICVDSQNDGRFVFQGELGEGGVFAFIQFFRGGTTPPSYKVVPLALPYHTDADIGKVLGLIQGTTNSEPAWVTPPGSSELFEATYNVTSYADIVQAIADHKIVYCRVPGTGSQARMAFLAYIGASNVEFQYYRSVSTKSASAQGDEVYVYTVSASGWTTTNRNTYVRIAAGTGLTQSYASGVLTLDATQELPSYSANEASKALVVNSNGDGVEWDQRVRGILTEADGQGGVTSRDIKNLRINTNTGDAGLVRVTPVGGSVQIIGYLAPDFAMVGDEGKLLRINSDATGIEWANPPFVKHDTMRLSSWAHMNPYTEEYPIFNGEMTFKMEWAANDHGLGPSAMVPYLKGKVTTASNWTAYIHVSKGASGNMTYQETSIIHGTVDNTYVDLSQCDYGNGFHVDADRYPMIVNMDIQYVKGTNSYAIGHLTWTKTDDWVFLRTTYDG